MPKDADKKPRTLVHLCVARNHEKNTWKTACGLVLTKADRAETVLADEREHVTCKACGRPEKKK